MVEGISAAKEVKAADAHVVTPIRVSIDGPASTQGAIGAPPEISPPLPPRADIPPIGDSVRVPSGAGSGGSSGSGHSNDQARRDNEDFKDAMAKISGGLRQLLEGEDRPGRRDQITSLIAQADTQVADADELLQAGPGQPPDLAFRLAAGHAALADDVEDAQAEAEEDEEAAEDKESIWARIRRWLGRAGRKLWTMISRLVTVREWSLTGTVGTSVLGLAGASISVTFGTTADMPADPAVSGTARRLRNAQALSQ